MNTQRMILIALLQVIAVFWSSVETTHAQGKTGTHSPVVIKAFAAKEIMPGDPWKVYISAKDIDGDMRYIMTDFSPSGSPDTYGTIPIERVNSGEISVYLVVHTHFVGYAFNFFAVAASLDIWFEDKKGNRSSRWTFLLEPYYSRAEVNPEPGEFKDDYLGVIPAEFSFGGGP